MEQARSPRPLLFLFGRTADLCGFGLHAQPQTRFQFRLFGAPDRAGLRTGDTARRAGVDPCAGRGTAPARRRGGQLPETLLSRTGPVESLYPGRQFADGRSGVGTRRLRVDPQAARAEQSEPAALQSVALVDGLFGCLFSGIDRNRAFRAGDDARPERMAGPRWRRGERGDADPAAVYFPPLSRQTGGHKRADGETGRPSLAYGFVVIVLPCRIPAAGRRGRVRTRRRRRSARAVRRAICGG